MSSRLPMVEEPRQQSVPVEKAQRSVMVAHKIMSELMTRPYLQLLLSRALGKDGVSPAAVETYLDWLQTAGIFLKLNEESLFALSEARAK